MCTCLSQVKPALIIGHGLDGTVNVLIHDGLRQLTVSSQGAAPHIVWDYVPAARAHQEPGHC